MNRKQKIIISIVGISIISLALIGLTYGYYLTRIEGNTNDKSISVTTADLKLVYGDNSAEILGENLKLVPSDTEIGTKTFTVTNDGNSKTSYVVVIEDVSITKGDTTTTFESNDFRYTLTCTKKDGSSCDGVNTQSVFPINGGILISNSIDVEDVQTYTLTLWYIDTGVDQSNDMGKTYNAKINITNIENVNPYSSNKSSLAYNIIENAKNKSNGIELLASPRSVVAARISQYGTGKFYYETVTTDSLCSGYDPWLIGGSDSAAQSGDSVSSYDEAVGEYVYDQCSDWTKYLESYDSSTSTLKFLSEEYKNESTLSVTTDDYGTSYYYRGNVTNNYINFAGMCWRIVRIEGDGSIKLILEDQDSTCASSDGNWNIPTTTGGTTKTGNFGYTEHAKNTLTASDGTKNSSTKYLMNYLNGGTNNDKSMAYAFKNFQTGPLANYLDKLKSGDWCLNDKAYATSKDNTTSLTSTEILDKQIKGTSFYYDSYVRLHGKTTKEPTLKCNGTKMTKFNDNTDMYVGTLTADEIVYAGGKVYTNNPDYYLINDYQKSNSLFFWPLAPNYFNSNYGTSFYVNHNGYLNYDRVFASLAFRPAVTLLSSTQITGGDGTKTNPYTIG